MGAIGINAAMGQAEDFEAEPPRPLMRPMAAPEPFPIEALDGVLQGAAGAIIDIVQVPAAMASQSVLAAASLATQGLVNVELPTGQRRPVSCFFITVAGSGFREQRQPPTGHASWPSRRGTGPQQVLQALGELSRSRRGGSVRSA